MDSPYVRKARLQEPANGKLRCLTCERRCLLPDGQLGWCRTRQNWGDAIHTLVFGLVSSLSANPIEKKPFYHFYPGSLALTAGSLSCNFDCPWCQNWHISKQHPPVIEQASGQNSSDYDQLGCPSCQNHHISKANRGSGRYLSPEDFVSTAFDSRCQGTSISFNEPTLSLEWSLDVFRLAGAQGLYNTYVTNGYMTPEALRLLVKAGLNGMNVDLKGDAQTVQTYCKGINVELVWRNCRLARDLGVHLELTSLVIPGVNDSDDVLRGIAERIVSELGADVPWHVSGYYPAYRFTAPPTPVSTLEHAWDIGKAVGLEYVYLGNVSGHRLENTYCPNCGVLLIGRWGLSLTACRLDRGRCPQCGRVIAGVWTRNEKQGREYLEMEERIGQVTHFYNRIRVAVLELTGQLQVGDVVHFVGNTTDFTQGVGSLEIEHQKVESVDPGADVALKVIDRVRKGDAIFKVTEE